MQLAVCKRDSKRDDSCVCVWGGGGDVYAWLCVGKYVCDCDGSAVKANKGIGYFTMPKS